MKDENIHIGDILYVKEWEEMLKEGYLTDNGDIRLSPVNSHEIYFTKSMRQMCGTSFTVKEVHEVDKILIYESYENDVYGATAQMLNPDPFRDMQFEVATDGEIKCLLNIST